MHLHLITLAFLKPHHHLEKPFLYEYYQGMQRQIRIGAAVAALFCALFSINDYYVFPGSFQSYLLIRFTLMVPACILVWMVTYSKHYLSLIQPAMWGGALTIGIGITSMMFFSPEKFIVHFLGYVQILFFLYTFVRLRFVWAASLTWVLVACYLVSVIFFCDLANDLVLASFYGLIGINVMGMLTSYALEYSSRKNFLLSRQLDAANQFLEERVNRRTIELTRTNAKLEQEINERKSIANDLVHSQSRYRRMVDNVSDYICVHDTNGRILEANHRMVAGLGYSLHQLIGRNLKQFMSADHQDYFAGYIERLHRKGMDQGLLTLTSMQGRRRLLEYSSVLAPHESQSNAVYCLARDITDTRRAEIALAESQARFKDIFETASAGMLIVNDETQQVVEINPAAAQMLGRSAEKVKGMPIDQCMRPAAYAATGTPLVIAADPDEWELLSALDGPIPVLKTMRPIEFDGQDHWIISISSLQKVKEAENVKREMQTQLMQSQHLQAIGTLAGGIAHDFNNILFGMLGYAQLSLDDAPEGSKLKANLGEIIKGSRRAKDLISQILTFSRQGGAEKILLEPKPLVKEALKLLRASIPTTIDIQSDFSPKVYAVHANTTQFHQIIMNLCTNAAHAMQNQGGLLQVTLDNRIVSVEEQSHLGDLTPGKYLCLSIIDNGIGIEKEMINRIFEPFFTTKPPGQGTGMGLSMVLGIVQEHGGAIRVTSSPGQGSRFDVLLPAVPSVGRTRVEIESKPPSGTEHILFVDDEFSLIQMGRQMLGRLGYKVYAYQHAVEALDFFKKNPQLFDLIITDLTMPKIKGTELARAVMQIRSDLPVILCTGNADQLDLGTLKNIGVWELITKPILRNDLAQTIRRVLSSAAARSC